MRHMVADGNLAISCQERLYSLAKSATMIYLWWYDGRGEVFFMACRVFCLFYCINVFRMGGNCM